MLVAGDTLGSAPSLPLVRVGCSCLFDSEVRTGPGPLSVGAFFCERPNDASAAERTRPGSGRQKELAAGPRLVRISKGDENYEGARLVAVRIAGRSIR
jgi:hypothetical protein